MTSQITSDAVLSQRSRTTTQTPGCICTFKLVAWSLFCIRIRGPLYALPERRRATASDPQYITQSLLFNVKAGSCCKPHVVNTEFRIPYPYITQAKTDESSSPNTPLVNSISHLLRSMAHGFPLTSLKPWRERIRYVHTFLRNIGQL